MHIRSDNSSDFFVFVLDINITFNLTVRCIRVYRYTNIIKYGMRTHHVSVLSALALNFAYDLTTRRVHVSRVTKLVITTKLPPFWLPPDQISILYVIRVPIRFLLYPRLIQCLHLIWSPGVSVSVDVRYSRVMERQYLNIMFTPTLPFKGRTEGLCGLMDDKTSNVLLGPRGELYTDPVQFGKSCKKPLDITINKKCIRCIFTLTKY